MQIEYPSGSFGSIIRIALDENRPFNARFLDCLEGYREISVHETKNAKVQPQKHNI